MASVRRDDMVGGTAQHVEPGAPSGHRPAAVAEWARHWRYERLPEIDLLRARYIQHSFPLHTHDGFTLGAIGSGVEEVGLPGGTRRIGRGGVVMINPEVPHSARAGVPEGWTYATLYPAGELIAEIAAETTTLRGTPGFTEPVVDDAETCQLIHSLHQAAELGNALAADSMLRLVVARLLRRHGGALPVRSVQSAGARNAAVAREILEQRMSSPPTLRMLATEVGSSPFSLVRAFRERYGLPPYAWLTDARVRRARRLLEEGVPPADAAVAVGFADQPHLGRHFRRIVGVPPGAYQRERASAA